MYQTLPSGGLQASAYSSREELRVEYIGIDPRFMEEDELDYELKARQLFREGLKGLEKKRILTRCIQQEENNAIIVESPIEFNADSRECRAKITDIARFLRLRGERSLEFYRVGAQLAHVETRIQRMHANTAEQLDALEGLKLMAQNIMDDFLGVVATHYETGAVANEVDNRVYRPIDVAQLEDQMRATFVNHQQGQIAIAKDAAPSVGSMNLNARPNQVQTAASSIFPNVFEEQNNFPLPLVANNMNHRAADNYSLAQNQNAQRVNSVVRVEEGKSRQKMVPIHRWHIRFSGEEGTGSGDELKLNEFLYLLHVQKTAQRIPDEELLAQIHWLLTDSAKIWYFSCYDTFNDWPNFIERIRERFLSPDHTVEAWHEITQRVQKRTESALSFLNEMVLACRSLPTPIDEVTQVAIIRRGFLPETRNIVSPWEVKTIAELEYIVARIN